MCNLINLNSLTQSTWVQNSVSNGLSYIQEKVQNIFFSICEQIFNIVNNYIYSLSAIKITIQHEDLRSVEVEIEIKLDDPK